MSEQKVARISVDVHLLRCDGRVQSHCPYCGFGPLEGVTGVETGTEEQVYKETGGRHQKENPPPPMIPTPGSISLCFACGGFLVFDEHLQQVAPTQADIEEWQSDTELWDKIVGLSDILKRNREKRGG